MDKNVEKRLIQKLVNEYEKTTTLYADFSLAVMNLLLQLLTEKDIKYQHISNREKDIAKIPEKIRRKNKEGTIYKKIQDIQDLAGVRIVFYLESDKANFINILNKEFGRIIKEGEEKYKQGGYNATHFILELDDERAKLTEYKRFSTLKCELQLTSSLYHAWSEVEHDITYKTLEDTITRLEELGLGDIRTAFSKVMEEHIQVGSLQLDNLKEKYEKMLLAEGVFGIDFIGEIQNSKSNDDTHSNLEFIENYFNKKPEEVLSIIKTILSKKPLSAKVIYHFVDQKMYGKTHTDLILKCLEIMEGQRMWYMKFDEVFELVIKLQCNEDKEISNKAIAVLKKIVEYDYVLMTETKVGYSFQRMALDYVLNWSDEDRKKNISIIGVLAEEILSSDISGTTSSTMDTITLHTSTVDPTEFLRKMRKETIDLLFNLIESSDDVGIKLKLIRILAKVSQPPSHGGSDEVINMIRADNKYLAEVYRKLTFGFGKGVKSLAIASTIEKQLGWINKSERLKTPESEQLQEDILADKKYNMFRLLVGDHPYLQEEIVLRNKKLESLFKKITEKTLDKWIEDLNYIASQRDLIEEWQFGSFKFFLRKIARHKPNIMVGILEQNFKTDNSITKYFLTDILNEFREAGHINIWDLYVKRIISKKAHHLVSAIVFSINLDEKMDVSSAIRDKDLSLIQQIVEQTKPFEFLKGKDDRILHFALIGTMARNYIKNKKMMEELIIKELKINPENVHIYINELFSATRNSITFDAWNIKNLNFLSKKIIESNNLGWEYQQLLLSISKVNPSTVFEVFKARIKLGKKTKKSESHSDRYEAIPYHINPDLQTYISGHPQYKETMINWITDMTWDWSIYNWGLSHFIERTGGKSSELLMILMEKGDKDSLMKVARIIRDTNNSNIELCLEVIKRTKNKAIINQIDTALRSTGVVMGHYGIAEAYENKAKMLESYKNDKNLQVKNFVNRMIKSFTEGATAERKRVDEETGRRKIRFEEGL